MDQIIAEIDRRRIETLDASVKFYDIPHLHADFMAKFDELSDLKSFILSPGAEREHNWIDDHRLGSTVGKICRKCGVTK